MRSFLPQVPSALPEWMRQAIAPKDLQHGYAALEPCLATLSANLDHMPDVPLLDATALRTLVLHRWRRLTLRHPVLPVECFPAGWRGTACAALTRELLDRLPRPETAALEAARLETESAAKPRESPARA